MYLKNKNKGELTVMGNTQVTLCDIRGPLIDLTEKLSGKDANLWGIAFKRFLRKENPWEKSLFKYDRTEDDYGWTLLEDVPFDGKQFVPEIVEFLRSGEFNVDGEEMKKRAKELNAHLGQRHAEYLLKHQELIPKGWRGNSYLSFPGTVWQDSVGDRNVPCLHWEKNGRWYLNFFCLGNGWCNSVRLVSLRK